MSGPRTAAAVLAFVVAGTGCTRDQIEAWVDWHDADPAGAEEWLASPEAQQFLDDGAPSTAPASRTSGRDAGVWDHIAWCESGGNWSHPPVRNRAGTFSGGLMIGHQWWAKFRGNEFAPAPYLATKAEQIVIAERIRADVGLDSAWQCWP